VLLFPSCCFSQHATGLCFPDETRSTTNSVYILVFSPSLWEWVLFLGTRGLSTMCNLLWADRTVPGDVPVSVFCGHKQSCARSPCHQQYCMWTLCATADNGLVTDSTSSISAFSSFLWLAVLRSCFELHFEVGLAFWGYISRDSP
jgi:hypothetical protein